VALLFTVEQWYGDQTLLLLSFAGFAIIAAAAAPLGPCILPFLSSGVKIVWLCDYIHYKSDSLGALSQLSHNIRSKA
jgi:hypothetical protein